MKKHGTVIAFSLIFTSFSILLHYLNPSTLRIIDEDFWQKILHVHQTAVAFKVRPWTTFITSMLHDYAGLPVKTSFFILQFSLLFISGLVFHRYLQMLSYTRKQAFLGTTIYFLSIPVLMAHFEPVHTWSDFWVYILIPLSFIFVIQKKYWWSLPCMILVTMARETSVIFYPLWMLLIYNQSDKQIGKSIALPFVAFLGFLGLRFLMFGITPGDPRLELTSNFETGLRTSDTLFSLSASLGFVWVAGIAGISIIKKNKHAFKNFLIRGAVITVVGYISSTLLLGRARETRLFYPPFIFLIPLTLSYLQTKTDILKQMFSKAHRLRTIISVLVVLVLSLFISWQLFDSFEYRRWADGNRFFWGLNLAMLLFLGIIELIEKLNAGASTSVGTSRTTPR